MPSSLPTAGGGALRERHGLLPIQGVFRREGEVDV